MMVSRSSRVLLGQVVVAACVVAVVELMPVVGLVDKFTLIPVHDMVDALLSMVGIGEFWHHFQVTISAVVVSLVAAVVGGVVIGYALWRSPRVLRTVNPYLVSYYAVPVFIFYPALTVMLGGRGFLITVIISTSWAIVAVILTMIQGLDGISPVWESVGTIYGLSPGDRFRVIRLRAVIPHLAGGVELAVSYAVLGVLSSEFLLAPEGLGYLIADSYNNFDVRTMWGTVLAVVIVVTVLAALTRRAVRVLQWPTR